MKQIKKSIQEKRYEKTKKGKKERLLRHRKNNIILPNNYKEIRKSEIIKTSNVIPNIDGEFEWNTYKISNSLLHHAAHTDEHPALIFVEYDGKILVGDLTHKKGPMRIKITNPNENDTEDSYLKRKIIATRDKKGTMPLTINDLGKKINTRKIPLEEREIILNSINNKKFNKDSYQIFINLKNKKPNK